MKSDDLEQLRVTALLKEYDTLRAEILARVRSRFELLTVALVGIGIAIELEPINWQLVIGLLVAVAGLHTYFGLTLSKINRRLAAVEQDVNARLGADVLLWESNYGSRFFIWLRTR